MVSKKRERSRLVPSQVVFRSPNVNSHSANRVSLENGLAVTSLIAADIDELQLKDKSQDLSTLTGSNASIHWRCIPLDHLRFHPHYIPLPASPPVATVKCLSDCRLFRQDSVQWDLLHVGRLTTSKLACILGLYEHSASQYLKIPRSLCGHPKVIDAWQQLRQKPLDWTTFLDITSIQDQSKNNEYPISTISEIWRRNNNGGPFNFSYHPKPLEMKRKGRQDAKSARLAWGCAQESTAVLVALNYLLLEDPGVTIKEVGMCLIESHLGDHSCDSVYNLMNEWMSKQESLPLLGASPDGIILHSDGSMEVLEVKCVSPFVNREVGNTCCMGLRENLPDDHMAVWHVPQVRTTILTYFIQLHITSGAVGDVLCWTQLSEWSSGDPRTTGSHCDQS